MTEAQLIDVLNSKSSVVEKNAACAQLKRIATAQSVPALSALLPDPNLSHSARYVLESMSAPEAGQALIEALGKTSGLIRAGLVDSLGFRRERDAVPHLIPQLKDADVQVQVAAARALGQIGGGSVLKALEEAATASTGAVHAAEVDGILRCAHGLLNSGQRTKAAAAFKRLYRSEKSDEVRAAAYRGMILAATDHGRILIVRAINGPPGPKQTAAVQALHEVENSRLAEDILKLIPISPPSLAVGLLGGLCQRPDVKLTPAVLELARTGSPEVRGAVIKAIGVLGDAGSVPLLAQIAATSKDAEQVVARQALVDLHNGRVTEALLANLAGGKPEVQAELAQALGARGEAAAVPDLMKLARHGDDSARRAALRALAMLADQPQLGEMVEMVRWAGGKAWSGEAVDALNNTLQSIQLRRGKVDLGPVVNALQGGQPVESRVALLGVCSGLADPQIRGVLRNGLKDPEARVRAAAVQALADTTDPELLGDLVELACQAQDSATRTPAVSGCVRLLTQEERLKLSNDRKREVFRTLLGANLNPDQKRKVLSGLGEVGDPQALDMVEPLLDDASVRAEAVSAVIKIVPSLADTQRAEALLKKVIAQAGDAATRQSAEAALKPILDRADYILAWQAAGPYVQADKDFTALFDIPFPPEQIGSKDIAWKPMVPGTDPKRPILMDLLKTFGGEQRVAYARTWIYSEQAQPARLEVGADDGVKVWFNGKLVSATNVARGIQPGSEKAEVSLNAGWNSLLLKVTQLNQGWEFCARFVKPDGSRLTGLKYDPAHAQ